MMKILLMSMPILELFLCLSMYPSVSLQVLLPQPAWAMILSLFLKLMDPITDTGPNIIPLEYNFGIGRVVGTPHEPERLLGTNNKSMVM